MLCYSATLFIKQLLRYKTSYRQHRQKTFFVPKFERLFPFKLFIGTFHSIPGASGGPEWILHVSHRPTQSRFSLDTVAYKWTKVCSRAAEFLSSMFSQEHPNKHKVAAPDMSKAFYVNNGLSSYLNVKHHPSQLFSSTLWSFRSISQVITRVQNPTASFSSLALFYLSLFQMLATS